MCPKLNEAKLLSSSDFPTLRNDNLMALNSRYLFGRDNIFKNQKALQSLK